MRILIAVTLLLFFGMAGVVAWSELSGDGAPAATPAGPGPKVATISHGEVVDVRPHLFDGHWTVVEFTADW